MNRMTTGFKKELYADAIIEALAITQAELGHTDYKAAIGALNEIKATLKSAAQQERDSQLTSTKITCGSS